MNLISPATLRSAAARVPATGWRLALLAGLLLGRPARAEEADSQAYMIAAGEAAAALQQFSAQSGWQVLVPTELINGVYTAEVRGHFTGQAALGRMFADTPLVAIADDASGTFALVRRPPTKREGRALNAAAIIVIGLAADDEQAQRFGRAAAAVRNGLVSRGVPPEAITRVPADADARPRRDGILTALRTVKPTVDETWLIILGQAAPGRNGAPMLQVSGPRLSRDDLATAINALPGRKFVVFGMAKSGGFLAPLLTAVDVEAVAATVEAGEINEPRFAALWADALAADPDGSFRDLALAAAKRVEAFYRNHGLGQGEHAQLLDRAAGRILSAPFPDASPEASSL